MSSGYFTAPSQASSAAHSYVSVPVRQEEQNQNMVCMRKGVRDQERPGFFTCCERRMRRYAACIVIDFWAAWCGPCQMMAPEFAKAAALAAGEAIFSKVNTDEQQQIAAQFRIQGIPAFALMRNGKVIAQTSGFQPAARLLAWMRQS